MAPLSSASLTLATSLYLAFVLVGLLEKVQQLYCCWLVVDWLLFLIQEAPLLVVELTLQEHFPDLLEISLFLYGFIIESRMRYY